MKLQTIELDVMVTKTLPSDDPLIEELIAKFKFDGLVFGKITRKTGVEIWRQAFDDEKHIVPNGKRGHIRKKKYPDIVDFDHIWIGENQIA